MELDIRIRRLHGSKFRSSLSSDDLVDDHNGSIVIVYSSNPNLTLSDGTTLGENAITFIDNPIVYPNMSYLYRSKLHSVRSGLLDRLVRDLLFLNPTIGDDGIIKMVNWIRYVFVSYDYVDKYKEDKAYKIGFNELYRVVSTLVKNYRGIDINIIESNRVVLYNRHSILTRGDKIYYSRYYRTKRIHTLNSAIIHEGALLARDNIHKELKITNPIILDNISNESVKTLYALKESISDRTIKFLLDENRYRKFTTVKSLNKWLEYLEIPGDISLDDISKRLSISKSTAIKYKKLI